MLGKPALSNPVAPRPVQIGAMIPGGLAQVKLFERLRMGDAILTFLPVDKAGAMAVARYCKARRIHLYFDEVLCRGSKDECWVWKDGRRVRVPRAEALTKREYDAMVDAAGEYYGARVVLPEAGGMLYWPKSYTMGRRVGQFVNVPPVRTVQQAKDGHMRYIRDIVRFERNRMGKGPLMDADSSIIFKHHAEAGVDMLCLESMPGDPEITHCAIRGAARASGKVWGTHIAMECYGGVSFDALWLKRWRTALYHAYICGAGFIWPESGHYGYDDHQHGGRQIPFDDPRVKEMRRALREAYQFANIHTRPALGPRSTLGVLHGNLDGAPGIWNRFAWGQFKGRKWREGPAERGWKFVEKFHRREDWPRETVQGEMDFSGNPPYGQYDLVPMEAPLRALKSYRCLVCLGWNTMTPAIYAKLKRYVKAGGRLVMHLPQLSVETDRAKPVRLFRGGDFRDLFGARILGRAKKGDYGIKCMADASIPEYRFPLWRINTDPRFLGEFTPSRVELGAARVISAYDDFYFIAPEKLARQPILIENSLGKGKAFLVTAWEYPADPGLERFTEDLLRTVLAGEQGDIRLMASDRVRYAVYDLPRIRGSAKASVIYLLNTDPDCAASVRLWVTGHVTAPFNLPANRLRLGYRIGDVLILPADSRVDAQSLGLKGGCLGVKMFSLRSQRVEVHNLGCAAAKVELNGACCSVPPGGRRIVSLRRTVDPARRKFFAPGFLSEPALPKSKP